MQRRIVMAALLSLALAGYACESATSGAELFTTQLAGSNEVPGNGSGATGACAVQIEGNRVLFSVETHGLSNIIGAHIHIAPSGLNGPIRVVFVPFPGSANVFLDTPLSSSEGILKSGSFSASEVTGITFDQLLTEIRNGNAYCNVHTSQFRGGEIRGQLTATALNN